MNHRYIKHILKLFSHQPEQGSYMNPNYIFIYLYIYIIQLLQVEEMNLNLNSSYKKTSQCKPLITSFCFGISIF